MLERARARVFVCVGKDALITRVDWCVTSLKERGVGGERRGAGQHTRRRGHHRVSLALLLLLLLTKPNTNLFADHTPNLTCCTLCRL
jgi:hypothetical protein